MFQEKIKPPMILTIICIVTCALLVLAYEATYVDNAGVVTNELSAGLEEIYGYSDGFDIIKNADGSVLAPEGVTAVLSDGKNLRAYEVTADGYNKGGIHVLVCLDENSAVKGISLINIGETPGLGTKVDSSVFLSQFNGLNFNGLPKATNASDDSNGEKVKAKAAWGSKSEIDNLKAIAAAIPAEEGFSLDAITGATYSSNGMYSAVKSALDAENEIRGGAVLNG